MDVSTLRSFHRPKTVLAHNYTLPQSFHHRNDSCHTLCSCGLSRKPSSYFWLLIRTIAIFDVVIRPSAWPQPPQGGPRTSSLLLFVLGRPGHTRPVLVVHSRLRASSILSFCLASAAARRSSDLITTSVCPRTLIPWHTRPVLVSHALLRAS